MKRQSFTLTFPGVTTLQARSIDVSTVGTALDGLVQDAPVFLNATEDIAVDLVGGGGDGVITVRAVAADTLRFRVKGIDVSQPIDVIVTLVE